MFARRRVGVAKHAISLPPIANLLSVRRDAPPPLQPHWASTATPTAFSCRHQLTITAGSLCTSVAKKVRFAKPPRKNLCARRPRQCPQQSSLQRTQCGLRRSTSAPLAPAPYLATQNPVPDNGFLTRNHNNTAIHRRFPCCGRAGIWCRSLG